MNNHTQAALMLLAAASIDPAKKETRQFEVEPKPKQSQAEKEAMLDKAAIKRARKAEKRHRDYLRCTQQRGGDSE